MLVALVAAKGTAAHRRVGWVFACAMALTSLTGIVLSLSWIAIPGAIRSLPTDPVQAAAAVERLRAAGLFFLVLSLLTGQAVAFGVVASRNRGRDASRHPLTRTISWLLAACSAVALFRVVSGFDVFLLVGGSLGLLNAARCLRPNRNPTPWLQTHVEAMLGGCTAATTAFVVQTSARISAGGLWRGLAWTVPVALGVFASAMWTRRLRNRKMVSDG